MYAITRLRKNPVLWGFTFAFIAWEIFLTIVAIFSARNPLFFDVLTQTDVSSQYQSVLPALRYWFEPFVGPIVALIGDLAPDSPMIIFFIIFYPVARILVYLLNRSKRFKSNEKKTVLLAYAKRFLNVFSACFLIMMAGFFLVLQIIGTLMGDILYQDLVNGVLHVVIQGAGLLFLGLLAYYILLMLVPKGKLKAISHAAESGSKIHRHRKFMRVLKEGAYFGEYMVVLAVILLNSISMRLPTQQFVTPLAEGEMLMDFHVHTTFSNGYITPEDRVRWYMEQGISGAAFTDRNSPRASLVAKRFVEDNHLNFTVLVAQEYAAINPRVHMNIYGLEEDITPLDYQDAPFAPNCMNVSDAIQYTKAHGGFVTINHYLGYDNPAPYTLEQLRDWGIDGIEVLSWGREFPVEIRDFCIANHLACMSGTDDHIYDEMMCFIRLKLVDPANKSLAAIFESLKKNEHQAVKVTHYRDRVSTPAGFEAVKLGGDFINYLLNLDPIQSLSWIIWSAALFILGAIGIRKVQKTSIQYWQRKILVK